MQAQHVVHILHLLHLLDKDVPVGFDDLDHHVVLQVLDGVHHALAQSECRSVKFSRLRRELFGNRVLLPNPANRD